MILAAWPPDKKFYDSPHAFLHALRLYSTCTSVVPGRIYLAVPERCASIESTKHTALFSCLNEDPSVCELLAASGLSRHSLLKEETPCLKRLMNASLRMSLMSWSGTRLSPLPICPFLPIMVGSGSRAQPIRLARNWRQKMLPTASAVSPRSITRSSLIPLTWICVAMKTLPTTFDARLSWITRYQMKGYL